MTNLIQFLREHPEVPVYETHDPELDRFLRDHEVNLPTLARGDSPDHPADSPNE